MKTLHLTSSASVVFLTLLFSPRLFSTTELYQWVDENGVKHFSQQPPAHLPNLQAVDVRGAPVISGGEPIPQEFATKSSEQQAAEQESAQPEKLTTEPVENPKKDPELCEKARRNIIVYTESPRVRAQDPETGESRILGEEERATQLKNWKERESTYC